MSRYDNAGIRTSKTVDGVETKYTYLGGTLVSQKTGDEVINFAYSAGGAPYGFSYNGQSYFYLLDLQGDIIGIYDSNGNVVVRYTYDSWGKLISITGESADTVGVKNPLRYRGYYYDVETELYYLQSRYYDPETCRFINADSLLVAGDDYIQGVNMFAYCQNNPVMYSDPSGYETTYHPALLGLCEIILSAGIIATVLPSEDALALVKKLADMGKSSSELFDVALSLIESVNSGNGTSSPPDHPDFVPPKKGNRKVKNPNGPGSGWEAKDGGVWVWTPNMHGGSGWTVQYPNGSHKHAYPGGGVRNHFSSGNALVTGAAIGLGVVITAVILADDISGIGAADNVLIPVLWSAILA